MRKRNYGGTNSFQDFWTLIKLSRTAFIYTFPWLVMFFQAHLIRILLFNYSSGIAPSADRVTQEEQAVLGLEVLQNGFPLSNKFLEESVKLSKMSKLTSAADVANIIDQTVATQLEYCLDCQDATTDLCGRAVKIFLAH